MLFLKWPLASTYICPIDVHQEDRKQQQVGDAEYSSFGRFDREEAQVVDRPQRVKVETIDEPDAIGS